MVCTIFSDKHEVNSIYKMITKNIYRVSRKKL